MRAHAALHGIGWPWRSSSPDRHCRRATSILSGFCGELMRCFVIEACDSRLSPGPGGELPKTAYRHRVQYRLVALRVGSVRRVTCASPTTERAVL
jgi:hypothetical protein